MFLSPSNLSLRRDLCTSYFLDDHLIQEPRKVSPYGRALPHDLTDIDIDVIVLVPLQHGFRHGVQRPYNLGREERQRVPGPQVAFPPVRKGPAIAVIQKPDRLSHGALKHVHAEERLRPTRRLRHRLENRGRPRVALDDERASGLVHEEVERELPGEVEVLDEAPERHVERAVHVDGVEGEEIGP